MGELVNDKIVNLRATLTQHGGVYSGPVGCTAPSEPQKKPPGKYVCIECKDASVTWHTPVDEYKVKCPKCGATMVRAPKPPTVPIKLVP